MSQAILPLNHLLNFFILPLAWAALLCAGTQWLFRAQVKSGGKTWRRRWLITGGLGCAITLVWLPINGGQSSMAYYTALGLLLVASEVAQLKIWRA
jgi:hypothetical protein